MIDANKYLSIAELVKTSDDFETLTAFLYNRGKLVLDKKEIYEKYDTDTCKKLTEIYHTSK
jgi:hypothetical protein